jgi:hypothetical protein
MTAARDNIQPGQQTSSNAKPLWAAPICGNCGAIESVTPIERTTKADGPGIGAVGGGVTHQVLVRF